MDDYYAIFGVAKFSDDIEEIRKSYRKQIMFFHPDHNNVPVNIALVKTQQLNEAYEILTNPNKKSEYDLKLKAYLNSQQRTGTQQRPNGAQRHSATNPEGQRQNTTTGTQTPNMPRWIDDIAITKYAVSAKKFSSRIFMASPGRGTFKRGDINSQDIYSAFFNLGYLEKRKDKYGNDPHYFPTQKGSQLGITVADRSNNRNSSGKMQISVFGEAAQKYFVQNCLRGLLK